MNEIIATSPKGAMFFKVKHYLREVMGAPFIANILIKAIKKVGPAKAMQVIMNNEPICKAIDLIVERSMITFFGLLALSII